MTVRALRLSHGRFVRPRDPADVLFVNRLPRALVVPPRTSRALKALSVHLQIPSAMSQQDITEGARNGGNIVQKFGTIVRASGE